MSLGTWLFVYVLGGITFLPLLVIASFAALLYLSPPVGDPDPSKVAKDKLLEKANGESEPEKVPTSVLPKPLQGWIIVRRTFDEPAQDNASYVGNLMRSYLASKQSTPSGSTSNVRRPRDTFYTVLKGTVLYLYEDEACSDCWAALQVSAYDVDIVGPEDQRGTRTRPMTDGELFAKRNAIRLRAEGSESETSARGSNVASKEAAATEKETSSAVPRTDEYYIFVKANVQMEDWYIALVHASACTSSSATTSSLDPLASLEPIFSPHDMNHLVRTLDQQPDPIPMRWLNALLGRLFFSLYRTAGLEANLIGRIMKKVAKVPRPAFLTELSVKEVNVGNTAPLLSKPMLKELTREGDAAVEMGLSYKSREGEHSGVRITVEATVTIDLKESLPLNLGNRFDLRPRTVKLVLAVVLRSLEGNLLVRVKRPPSNRIWYGFTTMPKMEVELLPIVSDRKIKWGLVLKPIENLLREVIQDSVVLPNMDDIPFFDTENYEQRGGIFNDAVRTVYEMSSSAATADASTAVSNADGTKITTVSPSTDIPVSAELDTRIDAPSSDSIGPMPGDLPAALERSATVASQPIPSSDTMVSRTGTTASLPAALSASSKRMSWLPRRFVKGADTVAHATGQSEARALRDSVIVEDGASEDTTPQADSTTRAPSMEVPSTPIPDSGTLEPLAESTPKGQSAPTTVDIVLKEDTTASENPGDEVSLASEDKPEITSTSALPPPLPATPPPLPPRQRSGTLGHSSVKSASGNLFASSIPSAANGSLTPTHTQQMPETPSMVPTTSGSSSGQRTPSKDSPTPNPQTQTATQALLTAWKNRSTDKQALANTARDVARDTMKKWGFGVKKDATETALAAQGHGRSPSIDRTASTTSRPSTPETKKTFEQMRMEVAERKDRRGSGQGGGASGLFGRDSPGRHTVLGDVFVEDGAQEEGLSTHGDQASGVLNAAQIPFRPLSPKPTTEVQTTPALEPSSHDPLRLTPPALPAREILSPDLEERDRRLSSTSQDSAARVPVQRQPGQGATMRIPGIHASHRGDVMSMGSAPALPPPAAVPDESDAPKILGPKTAATLQSMYRLWNKQAANSDTSVPQSVDDPFTSSVPSEPLATSPGPIAVTHSEPPASQTDILPGTLEDNQVHSRSASGSSAASALKQIQALDAGRHRPDNSRPVSRRASLARSEHSQSDSNPIGVASAPNPVIV